MLDNFNRIVQQVRNKPSLVQASSASSQANANASVRATSLAPAMGAPTVLVQPSVAVMQVPQGNFQPAPPMAGVDPQVNRASGFYGGQLTGLLSGPLTLNLSPDGFLGGTVNLPGQPVLVLGGQINNANGDFMLSGSSSQGTVMLMGRVDFVSAAMQGNWFLSSSASQAPAPGGSFSVKR